MRTDFSVFRERLAEACHERDTTPTRLAKIIGMSPRRIIDLEYLGAKALDIYRLGQIADVLDVSLDWLTGRSNVMEVKEVPPKLPKKKAKKAS
jgi:transcriptional regulator with XRE-family HTH domain